MRDPKRIDRVLHIIKRIWKDNPDLRLFQLLINPYGPEELQILYNQEEDQIISRLIRFYGPAQALKIKSYKPSRKGLNKLLSPSAKSVLERLFGITDDIDKNKVMIRKKKSRKKKDLS